MAGQRWPLAQTSPSVHCAMPVRGPTWLSRHHLVPAAPQGHVRPGSLLAAISVGWGGGQRGIVTRTLR
jgi:hypothetical protein